MNKSRWWAMVWLGLVASAGALASNVVQGSEVKPVPASEQQTVISSAYTGSYAGVAPKSSQDSSTASKMLDGAGYESSGGPGPTSLSFIFAGLGALAITAARRRRR